MTRPKNYRLSSFEDSDSVLPPYRADDQEYWFYRDPKAKDTLIVTDPEGTDHRFVNPLEVPGKYGSQELFSMQFGAVGTTNLLVYARSLEDALEEASGWLEEFEPGHLSDLKEEYEDALKEAREELGEDADEEKLEEKAREIAETDMTYTEAGYINSSEWWGGVARGPLASAAEYAASALHAAEYNNYDMIPIRPLGKGDGERVELEEPDILKMYADGDLGLTQQDISRITDAEEGAVIDLKGFKLERVG